MKYEVYILPFSIVVVVYFWTSSFVVRTSKIHIVLVRRDKWIEKKVSCPAFTWVISEIHKINFNQGKEWFSLKRTYHGFHSGGYGFLLCVKTAKRNKSIHNFLCYFGIILSNLFLSFLSPSVINSIISFRKYIKEHSLMCNFFPFCG